MSFGGATVAANLSVKKNAELRSRRPFPGEVDRDWGYTERRRIGNAAPDAMRKYLQEKYQAEVRAGRRNRRIGFLIGFIGAAIIFVLLVNYLG